MRHEYTQENFDTLGFFDDIINNATINVYSHNHIELVLPDAYASYTKDVAEYKLQRTLGNECVITHNNTNTITIKNRPNFLSYDGIYSVLIKLYDAFPLIPNDKVKFIGKEFAEEHENNQFTIILQRTISKYPDAAKAMAEESKIKGEKLSDAFMDALPNKKQNEPKKRQKKDTRKPSTFLALLNGMSSPSPSSTTTTVSPRRTPKIVEVPANPVLTSVFKAPSHINRNLPTINYSSNLSRIAPKNSLLDYISDKKDQRQDQRRFLTPNSQSSNTTPAQNTNKRPHGNDNDGQSTKEKSETMIKRPNTGK